MRKLIAFFLLLVACEDNPEPNLEILFSGSNSRTFFIATASLNGNPFQYLDQVYEQQFTYFADGTFNLQRGEFVGDGTWKIEGDTMVIDVFIGYQSHREFIIKELDVNGHSYEWVDFDKNVRIDNFLVVFE